MNVIKAIVVFLVFIFLPCIAKPTLQEKPYLHYKVKEGETVYKIAKKHQITPFDIYRINPDAVNGVKGGSVLLLPITIKGKTLVNTKTKTEEKNTTHTVQAKETLYSLARRYEVSVADLKEWNPSINKKGLQTNDEIVVGKEYIIPNNDVIAVTEVTTQKKRLTHIVQPKETKFGIAKKYNISIQTLQELNPKIDTLQVNDTLTIKQMFQEVIHNTDTIKKSTFKKYIIQPQETKFGLARKFNISMDKLIALNPDLAFGVNEGDTIRVPIKYENYTTNFTTKETLHLLDSINYYSRKEVILVLPFNLAKIATDTTKTTRDYIKKDKFLQLTLDYYSGAMMAIDSVKALDLPVTIKIVDVASTKQTSNIIEVATTHNFKNADAIIGPFFNQHTETLAQFLSMDNVPVVSPLSKDKSYKVLPNLYKSTPSKEATTMALINYLQNKENDNMVAIVSSKKTSSKNYLTTHLPTIYYPKANTKGEFTSEILKTTLNKDKKNYVILETEETKTVVNLVNNLYKLKEKEGYDIQLVSLEHYKVFNYPEIKMERLVALQLLYPSITKDQNKVLFLTEKLTEKNNMPPNYFVAKGFDCTFDTLLRVCQFEGFSSSAEKYKTIGYKTDFNYVNNNGIMQNNAVSILYYNTDYTIKQAE